MSSGTANDIFNIDGNSEKDKVADVNTEVGEEETGSTEQEKAFCRRRESFYLIIGLLACSAALIVIVYFTVDAMMLHKEEDGAGRNKPNSDALKNPNSNGATPLPGPMTRGAPAPRPMTRGASAPGPVTRGAPAPSPLTPGVPAPDLFEDSNKPIGPVTRGAPAPIISTDLQSVKPEKKAEMTENTIPTGLPKITMTTKTAGGSSSSTLNSTGKTPPVLNTALDPTMVPSLRRIKLYSTASNTTQNATDEINEAGNMRVGNVGGRVKGWHKVKDVPKDGVLWEGAPDNKFITTGANGTGNDGVDDLEHNRLLRPAATTESTIETSDGNDDADVDYDSGGGGGGGRQTKVDDEDDLQRKLLLSEE